MKEQKKETLVNRIEREILAFIKIFKKRKFMSFIIVIVFLVVIIIKFEILPRPKIEKVTPKREEIFAELKPATIKNTLETGVGIIIAQTTRKEIPPGGELEIKVSEKGVIVGLHSCGWGDPECIQRDYAVYAGQKWHVVWDGPYPRSGLERIIE